MEWTERMNAAVDYIERNLTKEIDINDVAEKANCSTFHFHRIFTIATGVSLAEYIRRRRLTLAASELSSGNAKVIDVALKYGYDSPDSFARAFRNVHGITPIAAREQGVQLIAFPRISFHFVLTGGKDMDYRIAEKPAFDVIGRSIKFKNNEGHVRVGQFWDEFLASEEYPVLATLFDGQPGTVTNGPILGVVMPANDKCWDQIIYAIAVEKLNETDANGFELFHVPAATYAIFDCNIGTEKDTIERVFSEWFPSAGYEHDNKPEIVVYIPEYQKLHSPVKRCELWYPVVKK